MAGARPSGTVTFLFTDIEGSTRLWQDHPEAMTAALARHDEVVRGAIDAHRGYVFSTGGDGFCAAFHTPDDAVEAAVEAQRWLGAERFAGGLELKVRMGVHTGTADERGADYFGPTPSRAARVMDAAWGGQILVSRVVSQIVTKAELVAVGEHRLRDLATSELLSQVVADGLPKDFPSPRTASSTPNNLPLQHDSFVGRDELLEQLAPGLRGPGLTTLIGVGGVGKTRLALQAAAEVMPHHSDGIWLCELAAAASEEAALAVVASALGAKQQPGETQLESIVGFLRHRQALVFLDNCEHIVDVAADLAEAIVSTCPDIHVVATSREGLAVPGERVVVVPTLASEAEAEADADVDVPGVQLFVDRARQRGADESALESSMNEIGEIVRRLDGLPLAIELAAARSASMTPGDIVKHLDARFELLTGGSRRRRDRTRTLQQAIDWSHDLLDEREQAVFRRLGVIAGSFDLEAAHAVGTLGAGEVSSTLDDLDGLVSRSLLNIDVGPTGETRYRYLETIRHYAEEKLEGAGEIDAASEAHTRHLAEFIQVCAKASASPNEHPWMARLGLEVPNIRRVMDWCQSRARSQDIIDVLGPFVARAVHSGETIAPLAASMWTDDLIDLDHGYRVAALAATHEIEAGSEPEARRLSDLAGSRLDLDDPFASLVLHTRAFVEIVYPTREDSYRRATAWARQGADLARELEDWEGLVQNLTMATYAAPLCGEGPQREAAEEAYQAAQRIGAPNVIASAAWGLGSHRFEEGDYGPARQFFTEAASLSSRGSMTWVAGMLWSGVTDLYTAADDRALQLAIDIARASYRSGLLNMTLGAAIVGAAALVGLDRLEIAATILGAADDGEGIVPPAHRELVRRLEEGMDSATQEACMRRGRSLETDEFVDFATAAFSDALDQVGGRSDA